MDRSETKSMAVAARAGRRRWPNFVALAVLCAGVLLSVFLFADLRRLERASLKDQFAAAAHDRVFAIRRTMEMDSLIVTSIGAFYDGSNEVDREEFRIFAAPLLPGRPSIRALEWAPRVPESERSRYEAAARADGCAGFTINERDNQGQRVPASRREYHFPRFYMEPAESSPPGLGFDLASDPQCREAMEQACATGRMASTTTAPLDPAARDRVRLRFFLPVYRKNVSLKTAEDRWKNLEGFVAGTLRVGGIVEEAIADLSPGGLHVALLDRSAPPGQRVLFWHQARRQPDDDASEDPETLCFESPGARLSDFEVAGRQWTVACVPTAEYIAKHVTWQPWEAALAVLAITGLLTTYLVSTTIRTDRTVRLADQLARANQEWEKELAERQRADLALRASEVKYKALYDSSADAIMLVTPQEGFLSGNPATLTMFGCKDQREFTSFTPADLSPEFQPDGVPSTSKAQEMMALALQYGSHLFDWTHKRTDGAEFPATVLLSRMELEGRPVLLATVRDVSQQKQAEQHQARSLRRVQGVSRLQEDLLLPGPWSEKFKRITDAAVELLDLDFCRIWTINPGDLCASGCVHAAIADGPNACRHRDKCLHLAASSGLYTHVDGGHRRVPIGCYKIGLVAAGRQSKFLTNTVTTDPQVPNHEWARSLGLASFAGYKLRGADGGPIGVLAMFAKHAISEEDDAFLSNLAEITSRVILESETAEALVEARRQAEVANAAKSSFLASMSHEIRSPMTSILGYVDLLANPSLTPSTRDNYLAVVRRNGEHLLHLINDILDLSKIEAGKLVLDVRRGSLVSVLSDVASMMRPRAEQRGNVLRLEYASEVPETVLTDSPRLRQALVNLVGNAVKFTENGTVRVRAAFLPEWRDGRPAVRFDVIDTGIGIREETLGRLFKPFTQADASVSQKYGGTGLGLAISREIVEMLGGELTVQSIPGRGSTFTLTVPTGDLQGVHMIARPDEAIVDSGGDARLSSGNDLAGVRILLAEDGFDNQQLIKTVLGMVGADVEIAENGRVAVEKAQAGRFDVVLMDMNMPEMDGYEATRTLRAGGYQKPILALTANAMSDDARRSLEAGCNDHLTKPIDRVRLTAAIAHYVGRAAAATVSPDAVRERVAPAPAPPPVDEFPEDDSGASVSLFADDSEMAAILEQFVSGLADHADAMRGAMADGRFSDLRRMGHQMKGSGGSYGYPVLTDAAKALEDAAKREDAAAAHAALDRLIALCRAIERGHHLHANLVHN